VEHGASGDARGVVVSVRGRGRDAGRRHPRQGESHLPPAGRRRRHDRSVELSAASEQPFGGARRSRSGTPSSSSPRRIRR
jgi:hypothetical protein